MVMGSVILALLSTVLVCFLVVAAASLGLVGVVVHGRQYSLYVASVIGRRFRAALHVA